MKTNFLRWLGIVLILEMGLLHLLTAQAEYDEAAYMGYLFIANFCGALLAVLGIYRRQKWGWQLGLVVAIGSLAGYAWSRTLGMPGMNVEEWFAPYGIVAMSVEGLFVLLYILKPWTMQPTENLIPAGMFMKYAAPLSGLLIVSALGLFARQWDYQVTTDFGHHVASLAKVCNTPPITFDELEAKYGVKISLVATSMMGNIVDVRIKIIDADKAHALLQNQPALLVGTQVLILAPHLHSHGGTRLKTGKIFTMFFPTQQIIKPGSEVSLVMGPVRVEPVTVR